VIQVAYARWALAWDSASQAGGGAFCAGLSPLDLWPPLLAFSSISAGSRLVAGPAFCFM
jgi:hypothetical protein